MWWVIKLPLSPIFLLFAEEPTKIADENPSVALVRKKSFVFSLFGGGGGF